MGMLLSMTGYGSASGAVDGLETTIELKSVNNRYLDCSVRLPRNMLFAENAIKEAVSAAVARGKIDVLVTCRATQETGSVVSVNHSLAKAYADAIVAISQELDLELNLSAAMIARMPDVMTVEQRALDKKKAGDMDSYFQEISYYIGMKNALEGLGLVKQEDYDFNDLVEDEEGEECAEMKSEFGMQCRSNLKTRGITAHTTMKKRGRC